MSKTHRDHVRRKRHVHMVLLAEGQIEPALGIRYLVGADSARQFHHVRSDLAVVEKPFFFADAFAGGISHESIAHLILDKTAGSAPTHASC